jgi:hypothetical protein
VRTVDVECVEHREAQKEKASRSAKGKSIAKRKRKKHRETQKEKAPRNAKGK